MPQGSNLINQCSMALDRFNRPHIVFYANDVNGITQYQHLRYDGKTWHHQILSNRTEPFSLTGGGTLQIPISRPDVLIDDTNNVYVFFRGDLSEDCMSIIKLDAPNYQVFHEQSKKLFDQQLGFAEPMLDREGWRQCQKLSMLIQHNHQPNHDINPGPYFSPISLLEFELKMDKGNKK